MEISGVLSTTTINRPGGGNGNPLQYSCLENPMDREAWWATVHGVSEELDMTELLSIAHEPLEKVLEDK